MFHEKSCCQLSPFSHAQVRGDPYTNQVQICLKKWHSSRDLKNERMRILFERQKEQILAELRSEIQKHELQADSDRRNIKELSGIIDSHRKEIDHTFTGCEQSRREQLLLQEELSEQNRVLRETRIRNMRDMEELQKSHVLKVKKSFQEEKLTEDKTRCNRPG